MNILIKGLITNLIFSVILFVCAGRTDYIQGWIFLFVNIVATVMNFLSIRKNRDLANERAKVGEGTKSWDKLLLGLSAAIYLIMIITAGLDSGRFFQTMNFHWMISISGVVIMLIGQLLFLTARSQNNFFSGVARIQRERGHVVCDTGLYQTIRHPGYAGMILSLMSIPLITTSVWSIIPTLAAIILLLIRTSLEDKMLKDELDGYIGYSNKTRYKLIPFIW